MLLQNRSHEERRKRVHDMLELVGLHGMEHRRPAQLSGGQQQRVAVARAMASQPDIILADEPTANLDSKTGIALLDVMRHLNEDQGMTFVFSTHDPRVVAHAYRVVTLVDGRVAHDEERPGEAPHEILPAVGRAL